MHPIRALSLLFLVPFAVGQYDNPQPDSTSTTSSSASAASASPSASGVQIVFVGQSGLSYSPNSLTATVGSQVEFHFSSSSHSVAQSSFSSPCAPPTNGSGFWSGVMQSSGQNSNVFRITINDTNPIWFYCAVSTHCENGMSGVINPPTDGSQSLANYQAAAAKLSSTVVPQTVQGGVIGPAASASASSTTSGAATSSTAKPSGADGLWSRVAYAGAAAGALAIAVGLLMA